MNILCIIETDIIGGPGKGILQLLEAFEPTEIHLYICGFSGRNIKRQSEFKKAVLAKGHPFLELHERFRFDPGTGSQIKRLVVENRINIIQTHGYKGNALAYMLRKSFDIPWISFVHGWTDEDFKIRIYNAIDRWLLRYPDRIVTVSKAMKQQLESRWLYSQKIIAVPNAVAPLNAPKDSRERIRKFFGISDTSPLIGVIGRLSPEKGQLVLLQALKLVAKEISEVRALLVGDGPDRQELERFVAQHNLASQVVFTGYQQNIAEIYEALDLVVMPSLSEGMPNVVLEALACGKPLIVTSVGGVPEVIQPDRTGILVEPANPEIMAQKILFLLNTPGYCSEIAENGRKDVMKRFSLQARVQKIHSIYRELLSDSN